MEREVTVKQHLWETTRIDGKGASLRLLGVHTHTLAQKDFKIEAIIELVSPADTLLDRKPIRTTMTIAGKDAGVFEEAAGPIVRLLQTRRAIPTASPQYSEFSTPVVDGLVIGFFKPLEKPSVFFLDVLNGNESFRFEIGDQDKLEELRCFFRQVHSVDEEIRHQRKQAA